MSTEKLSEKARRYLVTRIVSLERLDVLLLMHRQAARWWTAETLGEALTLPAEAAQAHLDILSTFNLMGVRIAEGVMYQYAPGDSDLASLVDDIARAFYADRHAVVALLARRSPDGVRLFAEAFRLRKDSADG